MTHDNWMAVWGGIAGIGTGVAGVLLITLAAKFFGRGR